MLGEQILNNRTSSLELCNSSEVRELYAQLAIINAKLEEPKAAQGYLVKLQRTFGLQHPKTKQVIDYFMEHKLSIGFE